MKLSHDELIDRIAYISRGNRKLLAGQEANAAHSRSFATAMVKHLELLATAAADRSELIDLIAYASQRNRKLLVHKAADPEADATHSRIFATAILRHLEQNGVLFSKKRDAKSR